MKEMVKELTRFIPTNRLQQYDVVNKQGQDMGQVQTFVVDMVAGRIAFVVVSFEGFLGISDKWFAMPWEILKWSIENKKFILDMSKEALEKAPGMDKSKWPDEINFDLIAEAYTHFGVAPYWDSSYPKS
jgi:sporulation protein YlmC with PRC-barrel domain